MKKNYLKPESTVVKIEMASMIATSDPSITMSTDPSETVDAEGVDSRYYDWDD